MISIPICKKCGDSFPNHVEIDGKLRNLRRRKYCLECSPFGRHNTAKLEKPKGSKEEILLEKRRKRVLAVQKRRNTLKKMAVEYKGGKCCICGYDRFMGALEFHHINPNEKSFGVSERGMTVSWERLRNEIDKCILVCSNCHREIEAGMIEIPLHSFINAGCSSGS